MEKYVVNKQNVLGRVIQEDEGYYDVQVPFPGLIYNPNKVSDIKNIRLSNYRDKDQITEFEVEECTEVNKKDINALKKRIEKHYENYYWLVNTLEHTVGRSLCDVFVNDGVITTVVKYPEIHITNSHNNHYTIYDLHVKIKFYNSDLRVTSSLFGLATSGTLQSINNHYIHSHLPAKQFGFSYQSFCLGGTEITETIGHLGKGEKPLEVRKGMIEALFFQLEDFVSWESLEGGPHYRIRSIPEYSPSLNLERPRDLSNTEIKNLFNLYITSKEFENAKDKIIKRVNDVEISLSSKDVNYFESKRKEVGLNLDMTVISKSVLEFCKREKLHKYCFNMINGSSYEIKELTGNDFKIAYKRAIEEKQELFNRLNVNNTNNKFRGKLMTLKVIEEEVKEQKIQNYDIRMKGQVINNITMLFINSLQELLETNNKLSKYCTHE
jgi:hypothetical protein